MSLLYVIVLAIVQGLAELLPVSSSAHVVVAEKLMGLDPSSPQMTLVLVMLHTGTMFAVIAYFWNKWRTTYFQNADVLKKFVIQVVIATLVTGIIGEALNKLIEKFAFRGAEKAEVEQLFSHLELIAPALAAAGILILIAGFKSSRTVSDDRPGEIGLDARQSGLIGAVQGLCLPFRGFSRSGATISTGMLAGVSRERAESFSFALAVVLTPPVIAREVLRLWKAQHADTAAGMATAMMPSLVGALCAFLAGLVALRWLSGWLESGRWYLFGIYCLIASGVVAWLHHAGY
jgi:undecaprenyl-diphosphatase